MTARQLGIKLLFGPLLIFVGAQAVAAQEAPHYARQLSWESKNGEHVARGVLMYRTGDNYRSRLFLETPAGNRLLLTNWYDPVTVAFHSRLLDEESGWRADFVTGFPDVSPRPHVAIEGVMSLVKEGQRCLNAFSTSDGATFEVEESQKAPLKGGDAVGAIKIQIRQTKVEMPVVPESLAEQVRFLRVLALDLQASGTEGYESLLDLVSVYLTAARVPDRDTYSKLGWLDRSGALMRVERQPDGALNSIRRFKSVSPSDPLEDRKRDAT